MARFVLALKDFDHIHAGATTDFIKHIGEGAEPASFDAQRVLDLARDWELYDEEGFRLHAELRDGEVEFVHADETPVPGADLVMRVNFVMGLAQARLDAAREAALEEVRVKAGAAANVRVSGVEAVQQAADVSDSVEKLRSYSEDLAFPIIQADLPVVLAALTEAFRPTSEAEPDKRGGRHDRLHEQGMTHP
jgi:hypothetical protein